MELGETIYEFFHSDLFLILIGGALVSSITSFRSCLLARAEKNQDKFEKTAIRLWLSSAIILFAYLFYIRGFFDLEYQLLTIIFVIAFSLMGIVGLISWYDRWRLGQKTLDRFL